jgi:hypothetical protein
MAGYKLTMLEKETIILFNEEEDTVCVDTFNQKLINRLRKAKEKAPDSYQVDEPDRYGGVHAVVPKNLLRIYFATPISEERREEMSRLGKAAYMQGAFPPAREDS